MNKERRKRLEEIQTKINTLLCEIEEIRNEEESAYENLPESLQDSERGENMQEAIDTLQNVYDELEQAASYIEDITEN